MNEISDMIFKHIENRHLFPIEKLKLLIEKYKTNESEEMMKKNAKLQHITEYMNTKAINDEIYNQFLLERADLLKEWKATKSHDLLIKLAKMRYTPPDIPDIFGKLERIYTNDKDDDDGNDNDNGKGNKNDEDKRQKAKPLQENIERPNKKPRVKSKIAKPWNNKNIEKVFDNDKLFWEKNKSLVIDNTNYVQPYDTDDVDSLENGLLTSATINIFMNAITKLSEKSSKYLIFPAEFYYQVKDIIDDDDGMNRFFESDMFSKIGDDWMNKIIIIPTNLDNIHWIITIINPYEGKIYVIDPYDKKNENVYEIVSKWKDNFLSNKYPQVANKKFEPVYSVPNISLQDANDTENCGVFISMYGKYFINNGEFPSTDIFDMSDVDMIRKYMLNVITVYSKKHKIKPDKECPPGKVLNKKTNRCVKDKNKKD